MLTSLAIALFANGSAGSHVRLPGVYHVLFTMAISLLSITKFFEREDKLIQRAENALQSSRLISFTYDGSVGGGVSE